MRYAVRVAGLLDEPVPALLDGVEVRDEGETQVLTAELDQAGLHGLLERIRVLGLDLIEVKRLRPSRR
jgi:hypothetical protein